MGLTNEMENKTKNINRIDIGEGYVRSETQYNS